MKTIKEMLEAQDPVIRELTDKFINDELSWDEYYDLSKQRLHEIGTDVSFDNDYERAMKGI